MTSLQERFYEKFQKTGWWPHLESMGERSLDEFTGAVLAFIEGTVQLERQDAFEDGRAEERQRITSLIEGMINRPMLTAKGPMDDESRAIKIKSTILDDLLTHLRGEETIIPEPDCPNCLTIPCKGWKMCRSRQEETLGTARELDVDESSGVAFLRETTCRGDFCKNRNCHKPRTEEILDKVDKSVGGALRALGGDKPEEKECEWCKANGTPKSCSWCSRTEETEKEGASFSGREEDIARFFEKAAKIVAASRTLEEQNGIGHREENARAQAVADLLVAIRTTPQLREQGGEWCDDAQNCPRRHLKSEPCKETNQ